MAVFRGWTQPSYTFTSVCQLSWLLKMIYSRQNHPCDWHLCCRFGGGESWILLLLTGTRWERYKSWEKGTVLRLRTAQKGWLIYLHFQKITLMTTYFCTWRHFSWFSANTDTKPNHKHTHIHLSYTLTEPITCAIQPYFATCSSISAQQRPHCGGNHIGHVPPLLLTWFLPSSSWN